MRPPKKWASRSYPGHNQHIPGTTDYLRSRTFQSYFNMVIRCYYSSYPNFHRYGGRGIAVCEEWLSSFDSFLEDMGHRPAGKTLDRKNVNLGYTRSNCRWASYKTQRKNQEC